MHELGIVFHIIRSVEGVARENNLRRVSSVTLELGEVSGVIPSYLTDCWDWACAKNDLMCGAELVVEEVPQSHTAKRATAPMARSSTVASARTAGSEKNVPDPRRRDDYQGDRHAG